MVTAAHCVDEGEDLATMRVVASATDYDAFVSQKRTIDHVYIHPRWDAATGFHDVAVLELEKDVWGPWAQGIEILSLEQDAQWASPGAWGMLTGWGAHYSPLASGSNVFFSPLQASDFLILHPDALHNYLGSSNGWNQGPPDEFVLSHMANPSNTMWIQDPEVEGDTAGDGEEQSGSSACLADSGSPFVIATGGGGYGLVSLLSGGLSNYCPIGWPNRTTRLAPHKAWIDCVLSSADPTTCDG